LHIITKTPSKYFDLLRQTPVEYVTFQLEDAEESLELPKDIPGKKGLAIITPTPVSAFDAYSSYDFILIMATIPGQSGGVFDAINFKKIRDFQKKYPQKSVHVDGGVNGEVSFILRNMGVHTSVSGSYLFNAPSVGHALMDLTKRDVTSQFHIADFMTPLVESPCISPESSVMDALKVIEQGDLGFTLVTDNAGALSGLVSNADVRKALIANSGNVSGLLVKDVMNRTPKTLNVGATVNEMLQQIKSYSFPILYLPVVDEQGKAQGIVTFLNLIKGEI
jgi:ribulose-phosphate 3-epimerase